MINGHPVSFSGEKIATTLNADGTQNLLISGPVKLDTSKLIASVKSNGVDVPLSHPVLDPNDTITLLWTNPSPASAFAKQTITVASGYAGYFVEFRYDNELAGVLPKHYIKVGTSSLCFAFYTTAGGSYWMQREATANANSVTFGEGRNYSNSTGNNYCIPTRIWGVSFTL